MGGLLAYLAVQATASLKRKATIYALMALSGLIMIFAMGYALNAGYVALMLRYGATVASLQIAGGLLLTAVGCLIAARIVGNHRPRPPTPFNRHYELHMIRRTKLPALAVGAGLASLAAVVAAIVGRRRRAPTSKLDDHRRCAR